MPPKHRLLILLPLSFLSLLAIAPVARLLYEGSSAFSLAVLEDDYIQWRIVWSFLQAGITCLLALCLGVPIAWVLARFEFTGRSLLLRVLMLPFVMPTLVAAMGVLALFGPQGVLGINLQDTPYLLLYGNLFFNLPLVIRAAQEGFANVPASQLAAARSLGATPWRAFWRVELAVAGPWILSGLSLVFLYCFSGFGLALLLGGQRYATVEVEIYSLVAYELNLADAGVLALLMLACTGVLATGYAYLERRLARAHRGAVVARQTIRRFSQAMMLALALLVLALCAGLPLLAVLWRGLLAWESWAIFGEAETQLALFNTARFTLLAILGAALLGISHALVAQHQLWLRALVFLPFIVSPVCVAFGLLLLYPQWTASIGLLIAAYTLLAYPFVARALGVALASIPSHWPQAAQTLGANPWRVWRRITWPLLQPALRRGLAFAAATALGEFAITLFLSRPEWLTLTTLIYQKLGRPGAENMNSAMLLSSLLMLLALFAFVVIDRSTAKENPAC